MIGDMPLIILRNLLYPKSRTMVYGVMAISTRSGNHENEDFPYRPHFPFCHIFQFSLHIWNPCQNLFLSAMCGSPCLPDMWFFLVVAFRLPRRFGFGVRSPHAILAWKSNDGVYGSYVCFWKEVTLMEKT